MVVERDPGRWHAFGERCRAIEGNVRLAIQGKDREVHLALVALLAEGHLLIEDIPGVGKTLLAKAMARSIDCSFRRIQFTPDLLPSDVTGVNVFHRERSDYEFRPGAVFANVVLGDEINRASPKTQSALLEAMEEGQVTVDGVTHPLATPFMVIATQNPIEHEGTYPLPKAQLDRFILRLSMGYPTRDKELEILEQHAGGEDLDGVRPVIDAPEIAAMIHQTREVHVSDAVRSYIVDIAEATRSHPGVFLGASPRASLMLLRAARAEAASVGRDFVTPDDVKALAPAVLSHRLIPTTDGSLRGYGSGDLVDEVLSSTRVSIPKA